MEIVKTFTVEVERDYRSKTRPLNGNCEKRDKQSKNSTTIYVASLMSDGASNTKPSTVLAKYNMIHTSIGTNFGNIRKKYCEVTKRK